MGHKPRTANADGSWSCNVCKRDKPASDFYHDTLKRKPKSACKVCTAQRIKDLKSDKSDGVEYTPTLGQIAAEAAEIREQWTDSERARRAGMYLDAYGVEIRVVSVRARERSGNASSGD